MMATEEQYGNRFIEFFEPDEVDEVFEVFRDLCDNGFDWDDAFRVAVNLWS